MKINIESGISSVGSLFTTEGGAKIHGIRKAVITMKPKQLVVAELEIAASVRVAADANFIVADPASGTFKAVRRIEFADGSVFDSEKDTP